MRQRVRISIYGLLLIIGVVILSGCRQADSAQTKKSVTNTDIARLGSGVSNSKLPVMAGNFKYAVVSWSPFKGIFNEALATDKVDQVISAPGNESLFKFDKNYRIIDGGAANLRLDIKAKTATITINKQVCWSDGQPLVAEDILYSYKILANSKSHSQRYTSSLATIVGLADYHKGITNQISGIELPDGSTGNKVVIHYQAMRPGMQKSGNGYLWEYASPSHQLSKIPFSNLLTATAIRHTPLYIGPYRVKEVEAGQKLIWEPNPYYYGEKPKLATITFNVISPNAIVQTMRKHQYDVATITSDQWQDMQKVTHTKYVASKPISYRYFAFKVGQYKNGQNIMNSTAKMNNIALRQAILYGIDVDRAINTYASGWQYRVRTLIPTQFSQYHDSSVTGYSYNPKKAVRLLDQAGYKLKGKWRTKPNGEALVIHLAVKRDDANKEAIIQFYLDEWHQIGLNVKLTSGQILESNTFYDRLEEDDANIDMFEAAWDLSTEPSPMDLYSSDASFNLSRFVTDKNTTLLNRIDSVAAFNVDYRIQAFKEWQNYMNDQAYVVPTTASYDVRAVNSRVKGFSLDATVGWEKVSVTSSKR